MKNKSRQVKKILSFLLILVMTMGVFQNAFSDRILYAEETDAKEASGDAEPAGEQIPESKPDEEESDREKGYRLLIHGKDENNVTMPEGSYSLYYAKDEEEAARLYSLVELLLMVEKDPDAYSEDIFSEEENKLLEESLLKFERQERTYYLSQEKGEPVLTDEMGRVKILDLADGYYILCSAIEDDLYSPERELAIINISGDETVFYPEYTKTFFEKEEKTDSNVYDCIFVISEEKPEDETSKNETQDNEEESLNIPDDPEIISETDNSKDGGEEENADDASEETVFTTIPESKDDPLLSVQNLSDDTKSLIIKETFKMLNAAPEDQVPVTADGITIEKIAIRWLSASTGQEESAKYDDLELKPLNDILPNQQFQIDVAFSGKGSIYAGDVEIVIPAYIWKDRNGNEPGVLTLAVPMEGQGNSTADFAWKRVGDTAVITNIRSLSAGSKYMIQGTFRMTSPDPNANPSNFTTTNAHDMMDIDTIHEGEYKGESDALFAVINVTTPRTLETISLRSNDIFAKLDTYVHAAAATKTAYDKIAKKYNIWFDYKKAGVPAELLPESPEDYLYVKWYADGRATGNQPFTMTITDQVENTAFRIDDGRNDEFTVDPILLGISGVPGGAIKSEDGKTITAEIFEGYTIYDKSCYVWVCYPKSQFTDHGATYKVYNTQTITVTGADDGEVSTVDARAEVAFRIPIVWKIDKVWNYNEDQFQATLEERIERRPERLYVWIDDESTGKKKVREWYLDEENNWHVEWEDDGSVSDYEAYEHTYDVSRWNHMEGEGSSKYAIVEGRGENIYTDDFRWYYYAWWYDHYKTEYDEATHTWTFYNDYHEAQIWGDEGGADMEVGKKALDHTNNNRRAVSDKDLKLLREGNETTPINYRVTAIARSLMNTIEPGAHSWETDKHGARYVVLELHDHDEYLEGRQLLDDEFRIASVTMEPALIHRWKPLEEGVGEGIFEYDHNEAVELFGLNNGEWIKYAELSPEMEVTVSNGATNEGMTIYLPEGITEVKEKVRSNGAMIELSYELGVVIFPTEKVQEKVEELFESTDYAMARSHNYVTGTLYNDEEDVLGTLDKWDSTYLHGRNYRLAADLDKTTVHEETDRLNRRLGFKNTITLRQQSNITLQDDYKKALKEWDVPYTERGVFYDLLPAGMTAEEGSFTIDHGTIETVDIIENYKETGRQLVIVKAALDENMYYRHKDTLDSFTGDESYPQEGYGQKNSISFIMWYPYDEAKNRGLSNIRNTAAYEADEKVLGNVSGWTGEKDDPVNAGNHKETLTEVREDLREFMKDLDKNRDDPSFVYAGANLRMTEIDFYALTSLRKYVQSMGQEDWRTGFDNDVNVYEGGKYSYQIILTSGAGSTTKDIILLDNIEEYTPMEIIDVGDANPDPKTIYEVGQIISKREMDYKNETLIAEGLNPIVAKEVWYWMGYFRSIDVTEIEAMGVAPVVYYCFDPNLDISHDAYNPDHTYEAIPDKLADGNVWYTEIPADKSPSDVKAIAIDCRKDKDGNDFKLSEDQSLIAYIHMQAPTYEQQPEAFDEVAYFSHLYNAHAYNNIYMDITQVDDMGVETHSYDHYDYTKVGIMGFDLPVKKIWDDMDDNDRMRPESVTVELYRDGEPTGVTTTLYAEENWEGQFDHVLMYDEDGNRYYYEVVEHSVAGYTSRSVIDGNEATITNKHEPETVSVPFEKKWVSEEPEGWQENIPDSITVRLFKDGVFTGRTKTVRPNMYGNWAGSFTGLLKYDQGREIVYTVDEQIVPKDFIKTVDNETNTITNTYYPYGDLSVTKNVLNATEKAMETPFTFSISLSDEDGDPLINKYAYTIYDENQEIVEEGSVGNGDNFILHGKEQIIIKDIPTQAYYEVVEENAPGFNLTGAIDEKGRIVSEYRKNAVFTNTYFSRGSTAISVDKELTGKEISRYQFRFIVTNENGTILRSASNSANGKVSFGVFNYTRDDDGKSFTYYVQESPRGQAGYTYDNKIYKVVITVNDNGDGTMSCTHRFFDGEEEIDGIVFKNTYEATGEITLKAWKDLHGGKLKGEDFEFQLLNGDMEIIDEKKNAKDGSLVFDSISYNQGDIGKTYYYYVKEKIPEDQDKVPGVIYDTGMYCYAVLVADNGDGTLTPQVSFVDPETKEENGEIPVFVNKLEDGYLTISKHVLNPETADPDQLFRFRIKLMGPDIADKTFPYEVDRVKDITLNFHSTEGAFEDGSTENTITVRLKDNGEFYVINGENVEPSNLGYTFTGWYMDPERNVPYDADLLEDGTDLYAAWELTDYAVNYVVKGFDIPSQTRHYGETAEELTPEKGNDFEFDGWYLDENYETPYDFSTPITGDITLYGRHLKQYAVFVPGENTLYFLTSEEDYAEGERVNRNIYWHEWTNHAYADGLVLSSTSDYAPWKNYPYCNDIYHIKIVDRIKPASVVNMFNYLLHLEDVTGLGNIDMTGLTSIDSLFNNDHDLVSADLKQLDVSGVTSMQSAFNGVAMRVIDLRGWDTSNVTNMSLMFINTSATEIYMSGCDTSNVANMTYMFSDKTSLKNIYVDEAWSVDNVIYSDSMFRNCTSLPNYNSSYSNKTKAHYEEGGYLTYLKYTGTNTAGGTSPAMGSALSSVTAKMKAANGISEGFREPALADGQAGSLTDLGNGEYELILKNDQQFTIRDIPAGTRYQVYEETPDGWILTLEKDVSGIIEPLKESVAYFGNTYKPGTTTVQFYGTKTLDNQLVGEGDFTFELLKDGVVLEEKASLEGGFVQFSPISFDDTMLGQHTYVIREKKGDDANINYDTHEETVIVNVDLDENRKVHADVTYDSDGVSFKNETAPGTLTIKKNTENGRGHNTDFTLKITFNNENGMPLDEEALNYYKVDAYGSIVSGSGFSTVEETAKNAASMMEDASEGNDLPEGSGSLEEGSGSKKDISAQSTKTGFSSVIPSPTPEVLERVTEKKRNAGGDTPGLTDLSAYPEEGATILYSGNYRRSKWTSSIGELSTFRYEIYSDGTMIVKPISGEDGIMHFDYPWTSWTPWFAENEYQDYIKRVRFDGNLKSLEQGSEGVLQGLLYLEAYDFGNLDTSEGISMNSFFEGCSTLTRIDTGSLNSTNVTRINEMFRDCTSARHIDMSGLDLSKVTDLGGLFKNCSSLETVDLPAVDKLEDEPVDMQDFLKDASSIKELDLSGFHLKTNSFYETFNGCTSLEKLDISGIDTSSCYQLGYAFRNCPNLKEITLGPNWSFNPPDMTSYSSYYSAILPTPPAGITSGKWKYTEDESIKYTPLELANNYNGMTMAGTWVWDAYDDRGVIKYDSNGGYINVSDQQTVFIDDPIVTLPDGTAVTRPHYTLTSWNTKPDGSGISYIPGQSYDDLMRVGEIITLYAQWEESPIREYQVRHYLEDIYNPGSFRLNATTYGTGDYGTEITPPANVYTDYVAPEPQTAVILEDDSLVVNYYYKRERYKVSFNGNGATSGSMDDMEILRGAYTNLTPVSFYRNGYIFTGWNTAADGSGTYYGNVSSMMNPVNAGETLVLYAQWMENNNYVEPTNGVVYITLKGFETVTFPSLPAGTTYTIEEVDMPPGWHYVSTTDDGNGRISSNKANNAIVSNRYSAKGQVSLAAHKTVTGDTPREGQYTFYLEDTRRGVIDVKTNGPVDTNAEIAGPDDENVPNPYYGTAPVRFDDIEYTSSGTYYYRIYEEADVSSTTMNYDRHVANVVVDVIDEGTGVLETYVYYDSNTEPLFTNSMKGGNLVFTKEIQNATAEAEDTSFDFIVRIFDSQGTELTDTYNAKIRRRDYKADITTVDETKYSHWENVDDDGNQLWNYSNYVNYNDVVTIPGAQKLNVTIVWGGESANWDWVCMWAGAHPEYRAVNHSDFSITGRLGGGDHTSANNTREYVVEGDSVTFGFYSDSSYCGDGYGYYAIIRGEGTSIVETGVTETTVKGGESISIMGGEAVEIQGLPHGATYEIKELNKEGWELLDSVNDEGEILAGQTAEASFSNVYSTAGKIEFQAEKRLLGGDLSEESFLFQLLDSQENVIEEVYSDENGIVRFQPIDLEQEDDGRTISYFIREMPGNDSTLSYDDHFEEVRVTVRDNGSGTLLAEYEYDDDGPVFTNIRYQDISVSKKVTGTMGDKRKDFSFILSLKDFDEEVSYVKTMADGTTEEGTAVLTDGSWEFTLSHDDSILFKHLPSELEYEIREADSNKDGYTSKAEVNEGRGEAAASDEEGGVLVSGTLKGSNEKFTFINDKNGEITLGVIRRISVPASLIFTGVLGLLLILLLGKRKRKA